MQVRRLLMSGLGGCVIGREGLRLLDSGEERWPSIWWAALEEPPSCPCPWGSCSMVSCSSWLVSWISKSIWGCDRMKWWRCRSRKILSFWFITRKNIQKMGLKSLYHWCSWVLIDSFYSMATVMWLGCWLPHPMECCEWASHWSPEFCLQHEWSFSH